MCHVTSRMLRDPLVVLLSGGKRAIRSASRMSSSSTGMLDYDSFLSPRSRARQPSAIRALAPLMAAPGEAGGECPHWHSRGRRIARWRRGAQA